MTEPLKTELGFLLRKWPASESDLFVEIFGREQGRFRAIARGALRSKKRFAGSLEPYHTLTVQYLQKRGRIELTEASVRDARIGFLTSLEKMEAGAKVLQWVRQCLAEEQVDTEVWDSLERHLDRVENSGAQDFALFEFGRELLRSIGYELETSACVRCGRERPRDQAAMLDIERGGIVCRACGGARTLISAEVIRLFSGEAGGEASAKAASDALAVLEQVLQVHGAQRG